MECDGVDRLHTVMQEAISSSRTHFVAVGGDGTVNAVVNEVDGPWSGRSRQLWECFPLGPVAISSGHSGSARSSRLQPIILTATRPTSSMWES